MTGPAGGRLAIAGAAAAGGGATIFAPCLGNGTIRRGPEGPAESALAAGAAAGAAGLIATAGGGAAAAPACGTAVGGAATTACGLAGGIAFAVASACLRSRIAFSASPGFETLDKSNFGFAASAACLLAELPRPPLLKYSRTRSAWSASIELECVFPVTPIASSASRIGLLFTSSSLARSLIRTLLIRPFSVAPCALAVHISLIHVGISIVSTIIPEVADFAPPVFAALLFPAIVAPTASHDRGLPYPVPRLRCPGPVRPVHPPHRSSVQSVLPACPHR
jgi:hypothetical protein